MKSFSEVQKIEFSISSADEIGGTYFPPVFVGHPLPPKLLHDAREELAKLDSDKLQDGEAAEIEARHDEIIAEYARITAA